MGKTQHSRFRKISSGSSGRRIRCSEPGCSATFTAQSSLRRHLLCIHSSTLPFDPEESDNTFASFNDLDLSVLSQASGVGAFLKCPRPGCTKGYTDSRNLKTHLVRAHGASAELLKQAGRNSPAGSSLNGSFDRNADQFGIAPVVDCGFRCTRQSCNKFFDTTHALQAHLVKDHSPSKVSKTYRYPCPVSTCSRHYSRRIYTIQHVKKYHRSWLAGNKQALNAIQAVRVGGPGRSGQAAILDRPLASVYRKARATSISKQAGSHACLYCERTFRHSYYLTRHVTIDHAKTPMVCDHCGYTYTGLRNLRDHIHRMHASARYSCGKCTKRFLSARYLEKHCATVHNVHVDDSAGSLELVPYGDETNIDEPEPEIDHDARSPRALPAPASFLVSTVTRRKGRRQRIHSVPRRHVCHVASCSSSFSIKSNLRRHMRLTHKIGMRPAEFSKGLPIKVEVFKPGETEDEDEEDQGHVSYGCQDCGKMYPAFAQLERHFERDHPLSELESDSESTQDSRHLEGLNSLD